MYKNSKQYNCKAGSIRSWTILPSARCSIKSGVRKVRGIKPKELFKALFSHPFIGDSFFYHFVEGKSKKDKIDSLKIPSLLWGKLIPYTYVYPDEMRATGDLMSRRNHFMRKRAELFAHTQNTASQYNLQVPLGRIAAAKQGKSAGPVRRPVSENVYCC